MTLRDCAALDEAWDDVIVGAGSSGAALAGRLSENSGRRVLLLEAGEDRDTVAEPPPALGTPVLDGANWDYVATVRENSRGVARDFPYLVGKVVGGSSAINGAIALRGLPADFDGWAAAGNPDWAWNRVREYFRRLESDADFKDDAHGTEGPVPIRRPEPDELAPAAARFIDACRALGVPELPDLNAGGGIGVGVVPSNAVGPRRISTADAYLGPARRRPNLAVVDRSYVIRVVTRGGRATGVELIRDRRPARVSAERVTLCAGAINTPLILQRSGIGAAVRSAALGLRPVADLPGVGENLIDHPIVPIWSVAGPDTCAPGDPWHQAVARVATAGTDPDVNLLLVSNVRRSGVPGVSGILGGRTGISVGALLLDPASRGSVWAEEADAAPRIALRLATESKDVERLVRGARLAWSVMRSEAFAALLGRVIMWTDRMVEDEAMLRRMVTAFVSPTWHPAGTARMGSAADAASVVDERCRVHGVEGLRVVDASVMPSIVRAPTNLTCIMLAERVSEWMS